MGGGNIVALWLKFGSKKITHFIHMYVANCYLHNMMHCRERLGLLVLQGQLDCPGNWYVPPQLDINHFSFVLVIIVLSYDIMLFREALGPWVRLVRKETG